MLPKLGKHCCRGKIVLLFGVEGTILRRRCVHASFSVSCGFAVSCSFDVVALLLPVALLLAVASLLAVALLLAVASLSGVNKGVFLSTEPP